MRRRHFLTTVGAAALSQPLARADQHGEQAMRLGLVTYLWGQDWDLPTLLKNCEASGLLGVELRTTHGHGVEPSLSKSERADVKKRFSDSPVTCVGPGSNENFDSPDGEKLAAAIESTKHFLQLSHDIGGSGVKVKPNSFHKGVPKIKTIEQIGTALNQLGQTAKDLDQEIRVEVHGSCSPLFYMEQIMEVTNHPNVKLCWNCNKEDLEWGGTIDRGFEVARPYFGDTVHVREFNIGDYPYQSLMAKLVKSDYHGWVLLEARSKPEDRVKAMIEQREIFSKLVTSPQS